MKTLTTQPQESHRHRHTHLIDRHSHAQHRAALEPAPIGAHLTLSRTKPPPLFAAVIAHQCRNLGVVLVLLKIN